MYVSSYSYSQPSSVSRCHAHIRAVVLQTLNRVQRDNRLCPLISYILLRCTLTFAPPWESSFTSLRHSSTPSHSAIATAPSRALARSIPTCPHHCIPTRDPGALSDPSYRSTSVCINMYCVTVFFRRPICSSIIKNTNSSRATASEFYLHLPSGVLRGSRPISRISIWVWNLSRALCTYDCFISNSFLWKGK